MKSVFSIMLLVCLIFSINVYAEDKKPFDCSKYQGTVWVGEISNPTKIPVRIKLYNNERVNGTDVVGITKPYFNSVLDPGEKAMVEYQCGENSVIFKDEATNSFKSLDFHVPKTFLKGENPLFNYKLREKKTSI